MDEHCVLMDTVNERVQSAKSGLTEACGNLLTGFEVSDAKRRESQCRQQPLRHCPVFGKKKPDRGSISYDRKRTKFFLNTGVVAGRGLAYR